MLLNKGIAHLKNLGALYIDLEYYNINFNLYF